MKKIKTRLTNIFKIQYICTLNNSIYNMSLSIGVQANKEKIGTLLAYVASRIDEVNLRKLLKLIFLIDQEHVKEKGFPLTWLDYYVWKKGPVAREVYYLKTDNSLFEKYIEIKQSPINDKYIIKHKVDFNLNDGLLNFSKNQVAFLDQIISKYGGLSADELSDITHESDSIWSKAVKEHNIDFEAIPTGKTDIKLDLRDLLSIEDQDVFNDALEIKEFEVDLI